MVARVWEDQHEWIPHPNSFSSPINLAGRAATAAAEAGPQHCGSQWRDRAQKMQLPGSKVGCVVRKMKLEGVCMLSVELGISYGDWRERGGDKEIRQETLSYCVSMGSGCVFAAGAGRVSKREAVQSEERHNRKGCRGICQQPQAEHNCKMPRGHICQAAFPGKNVPGDQREQLELHSMEWTGTGRGKQLLRAQPSISDGSRSQPCPHRKTTERVGTGWGWNQILPSASRRSYTREDV